MREITYVIKDPDGIHPRPAGQIVKTAKEFNSSAILYCKDYSCDLKKLLGVMGCQAACGDALRVEITGEDEAKAAHAILTALEENL